MKDKMTLGGYVGKLCLCDFDLLQQPFVIPKKRQALSHTFDIYYFFILFS